MTVIQPNSISGITSITAQGDTINLYKSDGTAAGLNLNGINLSNTSGVSTFSSLRATNINATGVGTFGGGLNVTGGNVGIGTDNPTSKLHLSSGAATIITVSNTSSTMPDGDTIGTLDFAAGPSNTVNSRIAGLVEGTSEAGGDLVFETRADSGSLTEKVRITSGGSVGIGTTNPSARLHVYGNAVGFVNTLTDGATITPDFGSANNFTVTLGGNRTIANPTNMVVGQSGFISIVQDGTGSRTVGWGSYWDFPASTAPTLTTTANGVDVVAYYVRTTTSIAADAIIGIGTL